MRFTGWHRLYVVAVLVWAGILGAQVPGMLWRAPSGAETDVLQTMGLVWLVTSLALLAVGYGVAWAMRGFRK